MCCWHPYIGMEAGQTRSRRRVVLFTTASSLAVCSLLVCWVRRTWRRRGRRYDGLKSVVGYSAKVIAAARALETERGADALIVDPLAKVLAGEQALRDARARIAALPSSSATVPAPPQGNIETGTPVTNVPGVPVAPRSISRLIMRTKLFDDAVLAAVGVEGRRVTKGLRAAWEMAGAHECTQVVLLGAGMDTRAWRLALPEGVRWFEVDTGDVLEAKRKTLQEAGAEFGAQGTAAASGEEASSSHTNAPAVIPLRAASYAGVAADLEVRGWSAALMAAGFTARQRTLWVLEGLLYYLSQDTVPGLMQEMADVSAQGSMAVLSAVSRSVTDRMRRTGNGITRAWKWGAPGACDEWPTYFAASGWTTASIDHWINLSYEYGLQPARADLAYQKDWAAKISGTGNSDKGKLREGGSDASIQSIKTGGIVLAVRA